eukprot:TRINITY_DN2756_c1_g1_i1.p1 TRINITY_DN2756_c1_g1~~TRINITY_DN2756_c1_g1_i1.p1  ORF type:complete len:236 (-),score=29.18 TRINITY_DN2756_c1_g1_i1:217-924(-)
MKTLKTKRNKIHNSCQYYHNSKKKNFNEQIKIIKDQIDKKQNLIQKSGFFKSLIESWKLMKNKKGGINPEQMIIYGLGSLTVNTNSQFQFALALELKKFIGIQKIQIYDPIFTKIDKSVLRQYDVDILKIDEKCKKNIHGVCTLFYLPHLEKEFINNLLGANQIFWDKIYILGNRLQNYVEVEFLCGVKCPKFVKLFSQGGFEIEIYEAEFPSPGAFNNMGLSIWKGAKNLGQIE